MSTSFTVNIFRPILTIIMLFLLVYAVATAQSSDTTVAVAVERPVLVMKTSMGDITIELDPERAPQTVSNFMAYVDNSFYTDTIFHRVIEGFMIQGGGFSTEYNRKATQQPVSNEAYNGLRNNRYTIAMARTTAPHSATSQFFINTENNDNLNHTDTSRRGWGYTVFGKVIDGQNVVDAISTVPTAAGGPFSQDVPVKPVVILGVERMASTPLAAAELDAAADTPAVKPAD